MSYVSGRLPQGVTPSLGPDATALGQVFWYTLEGRGPEGELVGGWDLHELRSIQDWVVRFALQAVPGVSEVASVGGYVRDRLLGRASRDVDLEVFGVSLAQLRQLLGACGEVLEVGRAFGVLEKAANALSEHIPPDKRPPAQMFSAHIWAMSHGVVELFARQTSGQRASISPEDLLESGVMVYLRGLGLIPEDR